jgi:molybdopterin molybdotransferase
LLTVKTPSEVTRVIINSFQQLETGSEDVLLNDACGRSLFSDIICDEYVPGFDRSTVDGYAVIAADTFGCSASIPALLNVAGEVLMGDSAEWTLAPGDCAAVSTGGDLPGGANAVVMLENTENYGDGLVGIMSPVAPGNNIMFKGDDVKPGDKILDKATVLTPHDIGILSAIGQSHVKVFNKPIVGVISTGDELVKTAQKPMRGQVREVNMPLICAAVAKAGAMPKSFGIIRDDREALEHALSEAARLCDIVLISGGSSAGMKDLTSRVIEAKGKLLLHGIAMKPGKPTILGDIGGKPVFGLPGHPVAAYFVTELFVLPLISLILRSEHRRVTVPAALESAISANHGRAEYIAVALKDGGKTARPIRGKSGLIASLSRTDGYICVPRDCEGIAKGARVEVFLWGSKF